MSHVAPIKAEYIYPSSKTCPSSESQSLLLVGENSSVKNCDNGTFTITNCPIAEKSTTSTTTATKRNLIDDENFKKSDEQNDPTTTVGSFTPAPKKIKRPRGLNKKRPREKWPLDSSTQICSSFAKSKTCSFGEKCKYSHDLDTFWKSRQRDDLGPICPIYDVRGFCPYGVTCRYAGCHVDENLNNLTNNSKRHDVNLQQSLDQFEEINRLDFKMKSKLQKRSYDFGPSLLYLKTLAKNKKSLSSTTNGECSSSTAAIIADETPPLEVEEQQVLMAADENEKRCPKRTKAEDWKRKLYLAPLTTLGNLPFRRICVGFGAEITCGEMALATELLQGNQSEWALLRRHPSEKFFGVQLCGGHSDTMTKCAQILRENCQLDFIDLNIACPIDLICQKGAGCMLMNRTNRLSEIVQGVNSVIGDIPLTMKIRTGVYDGKNVAHSLVKNLERWNISACVLHGRSREQRYTKIPDWPYVNACASAATPVPLLGCGDILSYEDYYERLETCQDVSGVVIARGALIKPWIFTEITERRHWDIRSSERLEILKDYVKFGLEHWGTDDRGVEITRRFLLEWLSFLYRYIPVGLLERLPQRMNERPPRYFGRDDLETLMASPNCQDWVKISEILLGPVAPDFQFLPKHKANSYDS